MSNPLELLLTVDDMNYFRHQARQYWMDQNPDRRLPGQPMAMSEADFLAMSWIQAAADVMARRGVMTKPVFVVDILDPAPDTEHAL